MCTYTSICEEHLHVLLEHALKHLLEHAPKHLLEHLLECHFGECTALHPTLCFLYSHSGQEGTRTFRFWNFSIRVITSQIEIFQLSL